MGFWHVFTRGSVAPWFPGQRHGRSVHACCIAVCMSPRPPQLPALPFPCKKAAHTSVATAEHANPATLTAGRAIVDEVLPPRFLAEAVPHLEPDSLGIAVVQQTGGWASGRAGGRAGGWVGGWDIWGLWEIWGVCESGTFGGSGLAVCYVPHLSIAADCVLFTSSSGSSQRAAAADSPSPSPSSPRRHPAERPARRGAFRRLLARRGGHD